MFDHGDVKIVLIQPSKRLEGGVTGELEIGQNGVLEDTGVEHLGQVDGAEGRGAPQCTVLLPCEALELPLQCFFHRIGGGVDNCQIFDLIKENFIEFEWSQGQCSRGKATPCRLEVSRSL